MSRTLWDNFINRHITGPKALMTMVESLAARVGGMESAEMISDPALWGANLAKTGRLLDMDGLVMGFDPDICQQAYRSDQPPLAQKELTVFLEAFERFGQTEKNYFGCVANMSGPLSLAASLAQEGADISDVKQKTVEIAEAFCKSRPDILMFREGAALGQSPVGMPQRKTYNTLKNMAAYYSVPLGIFLENYNPEYMTGLAKLKIPFVFFGADQQGSLPPLEALIELEQDLDGIGVPLDFTKPDEARAQAETYVAALPGVNFMFTNLQELNRDTDLEATLALVSELRRIGNEL